MVFLPFNIHCLFFEVGRLGKDYFVRIKSNRATIGGILAIVLCFNTIDLLLVNGAYYYLVLQLTYTCLTSPIVADISRINKSSMSPWALHSHIDWGDVIWITISLFFQVGYVISALVEQRQIQ